MCRRVRRSKGFFFEKKKQKTFPGLSWAFVASPAQTIKSFFVLFFKKEHRLNCVHERPPPDEARPLHALCRLPRRRLAPPGCRPRRRLQVQPLPACRADRRGGEVRHGVSRRRHRPACEGRAARLAVPLGAECRAGAADAAIRAGADDAPYRPGRHRIDHLQRTVPHRAQIRLAGPDQRRSRRLERGDVLVPGRGAQLQPRDASRLRHPLRPRGGIRRGGEGPLG